MIIDNDPRAGRPRTSTDERSVELVADALEVCGEFTVNHSTVSHWDNCSHGDCVIVDYDPRAGRPRSSIDERRFVADALEVCGEFTVTVVRFVVGIIVFMVDV